MTWRLELTPKARKELDAVPEDDRARIQFKLWDLKSEPRPQGSAKIKGSSYYRIRQGDWRIVYLIDATQLVVLIVRVLRRNERTYEFRN